MSDLSLMPATELAQRYADGSVSPVEATEAALDAISAHDSEVHAFVLVDADGARDAARASEERWRHGSQMGPWDGIPTTIKDILLTKGWPTLRGTKFIDEAGPWVEDAPSVARLRAAAVTFLGKTTTPEFAWKGVTDSIRYGATGNPWGAHLTSGGSSGGSATAVGLGMGTWSVGTDGGGSVRIPAAFTGTVALKPTYGLMPMYPPSPFGTLSHGGPMARTVLDAAAMLDVLVGFDARDWSAMPTPTASFTATLASGLEGLRVALSPTLGHVRNDPDVEEAVRAAAHELEAAGAVVEEVDPGFDDPIGAFEVLWFTGAAKVLAAYGPEAIDKVDPGLRDGVLAYLDATAGDYLDATAVRMDLGMRMGRFHQTYDVLVTPTMPIPAFPAGQDAPDGWPSQRWTSWTPYTYPFNMTQQPALSVPCGFTSAGLPVGMQVVGPRHADATVLRVGHAFQLRTRWHDAVPHLLDHA
jgi:aspartyl-tRNA(Asn)/glutamyl-tRNA(Gln) amidotransferase subunit A